MFRITLAVVLFPLLTNGYPMFQGFIPNGKNIPHPCLEGKWDGVGHESAAGGGPRNPFGKAFNNNGKVWNRTLCEMDSDGDGKSNGVELGDPECRWTKESPTNLQTTGLSHPGICEPLDSSMCAGKNNFLNCQVFDCPVTTDPSNSHFRIHFDDAEVPLDETSYHCMPFMFPNDTDNYMLAYEPIVNNSNVLHHIVVYGCKDESQIKDSDLNKPYNCFMGDTEGCDEVLAVWALGIDGYCFPEGVGLKVGKTGFKKAILEVHWTNPMNIPGYRDSSGLDITITSVQQPNEAGVLMIGQGEMYIPPNKTKELTSLYPVEGKCPGYCTNQFMSGDVTIFSVFNHMHYLGQSIRSSVVIPNTREDYLAYDRVYDYNRPLMHALNPPIVVQPGHELKLHCDFNSTTRNTTTKWGLGTFDEMCYSFLFYYPANRMSVSQCVTTGIFEECENPEAPSVYNGCDFSKVFDITRPEVQDRYEMIPKLCDHHRCLTECKMYLKALFEEPCYTRENRPYLKRIFFGFDENQYEIREFWSLVQSCDWELGHEAAMVNVRPTGNDETSSAGSDAMNVILNTCLLAVVALFK